MPYSTCTENEEALRRSAVHDGWKEKQLAFGDDECKEGMEGRDAGVW